MSNFNYDIEATTKYTFESATLDGKASQNETPTPLTPINIEVVKPNTDNEFGFSINNVLHQIDLNGNVLASLPPGTSVLTSGALDTIEVDNAGNVTLYKETAIITLDGSDDENWSVASNYANQAVSTALRNSILRPPTNDRVVPLLCTRFTAESANDVKNGTVGLGVISTGSIVVRKDDQPIADIETFKTWLSNNPITIVYPLASNQTSILDAISVSDLADLESAYPLTVVAAIETTGNCTYTSKTTYEVLNPYEDSNAPEYAFPPNHPGQDWETFDPNDWDESDMLDYTGQFESHAVYTVELCELMQSGVFNWSRPELDWSEAAYNQEQYERFCNYFEQRFMFREIGILPPLQWFTALKRMLVFELMPKYSPMYAQIENGISPLGENEYLKRRHITSNYPETLLSNNSDYITTGDDEEYERIKIDNAAQALKEYREGFSSVDKAIGDELEVLFMSMYTSYVNGL